jgi:3-oxoacyl-[acyl-carrier-protein] synthase-3
VQIIGQPSEINIVECGGDTARLLQDRLRFPVIAGAGALDFNLGCSGYVCGNGLAEGSFTSSILLLTAETYIKDLG